MQTETFMQMVDRFIILRLKMHHCEADKRMLALTLQAHEIAIAADTYLYECLHRKRLPEVRPSFRHHDHNEASGVKKQDSPPTLMECISQLCDTHSEYWSLQTAIQSFKKRLREEDEEERSVIRERFVSTQELIDLCNQRRNDLIQQGDELLRESIQHG